MALMTSSIPSLVGLIPTFLMVMHELGVISPATRKYVADDMSPGTRIFCPKSFEAGFTVAVVPSVLISPPNDLSMSSVWFLDTYGSVTLVSPSA